MSIARDIPERYRKAYDRAMTGKSKNAAIRSFCLECVSYDRAEVVACTDHGCPLYPYRPGHGSQVKAVRPPMTEEHKAKLAAGLAKARLNRPILAL